VAHTVASKSVVLKITERSTITTLSDSHAKRRRVVSSSGVSTELVPLQPGSDLVRCGLHSDERVNYGLKI